MKNTVGEEVDEEERRKKKEAKGEGWNVDGASIVGKYGYVRDRAIECVWCLDDRTKEKKQEGQ